MSDNEFDAWLVPHWVVRTVMFVDACNSVRMSKRNETDFIARWLQFVELTKSRVLGGSDGQLVRQKGDDMLLAFQSAQSAVKAALAIQGLARACNDDVPDERKIHIRIGAHTTRLVDAKIDLLGHGVNLAALITRCARPGEILVSSEVRHQLAPVLDADVEDLGELIPDESEELELHLRDLDDPIRAYRLGPPGARPMMAPETGNQRLQPTIAVIPFVLQSGGAEHRVIGEVLADDIIVSISQSSGMQVISRLSTTQLRDRDITPMEVRSVLAADYVVSGRFRVVGPEVVLSAELVCTDPKRASTDAVRWTDRLHGNVNGILRGDDRIVTEVVDQITHAVITEELKRARSAELPTLQSYTLMMAAIACMHQGHGEEFLNARRMLDVLTERVRGQPVPYAWLGKWHVLNFNRGYSTDSSREANLALDATKRALDLDPDCSLALTVDGFVRTNLLKRFDEAEASYRHALRVNPNESLAHLLLGTLHAFKGDGAEAVRETDQALRLSPIDPMRYFYESLAATAYHSAGRYERAIELARSSVRANRFHQSTWRAMAIAQVLSGQMDEARETVQELRKLDPKLTVETYLESNPGGALETGKRWAEALALAGLPRRER